jgi:GxxExxY protein
MNELTHSIIAAAIEIHRSLGPGLLEAANQECLGKELSLRNIPFKRQKPIPLVYRDLNLNADIDSTSWSQTKWL